MNEIQITALICSLLGGGDAETRQKLAPELDGAYIKIDCETPTHVIEVAKDNTNRARDSVQQAVFASVLTGKVPMVIVIDTDGKSDRYQYELQVVTKALGIEFGVCRESFIVRWMAAWPFRAIKYNDLPDKKIAIINCDIDLAAPGEKLVE